MLNPRSVYDLDRSWLVFQIANGKQADQPKAANMMALSWDSSLEEVAQRLADQCVFGHDDNKARLVPNFDSVGQNIYLSISSKKKEDVPSSKAVKNWYLEVLKFKSSQIKPFKFNHGIGHYSQLAWATTHKVGCGASLFKVGSKWKRIVVCNYGPMGNMAGGEMYKTGEPCSACPAGTSCSGGLCK